MSKNRPKNKEKPDKHFLKISFPHAPVICLTAKFQHCSMRQSPWAKVRTIATAYCCFA